MQQATSISFWETEGFAGLCMWSVLVVQLEQHVIYRLMAGGGQGGPSWHGRNWRRRTAVSGSSWQLTLKIEAPGDQVWDGMQLASYLEGGPDWFGWCTCTLIKNLIMMMMMRNIWWLMIFKTIVFPKILWGIPSECQTVWIQLRLSILSPLIWVQTFSRSLL